MRVEVVTASVQLRQLCNLLREAGVVSYTIFRNVQGQGERGWQGDDELTGISANSYLLTTCTREQLPRVTDAIRSVLREFGGECFVSETVRIKH